MKYLNVIVIIVLLTLSISCENNTSKNNSSAKIFEKRETGRLYPNIKVKNDSTLSYALYLPSGYNSEKVSRVMFVFDAHADGMLPVKKYKSLAEKYNLLVVASNNSKNDISASERNRIIMGFISDVEKRFNVDKNNYITAGFSGGARIAALIGLFNDNVVGVIECGAGFPQVQKPKNKSFNWVGIVGNTDFNYLEMKNLYNQLKFSGYKPFLLVFDGKHEWPPENVMDEALGIVLRNNTRNLKYEIKDASKVTRFDKVEVKLQNMLVRNFTDKDISWWKREIIELKDKTKNAATKDERLMNARLLSYLGMISYVLTDQAVKVKNVVRIKKYITIYEMTEPDNPDMYYFKSVYYTMNNQNKKALEALKTAVDNGFDDFSKIQKTKEFEVLKDSQEFKNIIAGLQ
jgi:hypothetical protein